MNKEEIDYGLAIEDLQRPDGLRELAKIQLNRMVENSREQYIKSLQQENKQLKEEIKQYQKELEKADSITQSCIFQGKEEIIEYIKHNMPIIIQYENGCWCNAKIEFKYETLVVYPNYKILFED